MNPLSSVASIYACWHFIRSFLHRGWWLVTSLYLVTEAQLSPIELVFLGTAQGLTVLAAEIPTGVFADTYSRKWSLVIAHVIMGLGMLSTGLVTAFPALVVTQMIWGLSWTFCTGADVAWLTDELNQPEQTAQALSKGATWGLVGSAVGITALGGLAWLTSLATAIVVAGLGMWILGVVVALLFRETRFQRSAAGFSIQPAIRILANGYRSVRTHRILLLIMLCTVLVNGADEAFGRLHAKRLVDQGLPQFADPIVWLGVLSVTALGLGVVALSILTKRLAGDPRYDVLYAVGTLIGAMGLVVFAMAPTVEVALAGALVVSGIAWTVMRTVSVIWANQHALREVRATVQSFLSLAEHAGEIVIGFSLAVVAQLAGIDSAMIGSCAVLVLAGYLVLRCGRDRG